MEGGSIGQGQFGEQTNIRVAVDDLEGKLSPEFRKFLRQIGSDYDNGRNAFAPLCDLYSALQRNDVALVKALLLGPLEGARSTLTYAISHLTNNLHDIDDELIELILNNLSLLSKASTEEIAPHLGTWLWKHRLNEISGLLESPNTVEGNAVRRSLLGSGLPDVFAWLKSEPLNLAAILPLRPDLLSASGIWDISKEVCEIAMQYVANNPGTERQALSSAITSVRANLPDLALRNVGSKRMLIALLAVAESAGHRSAALDLWFRTFASPNNIGTLLNDGVSFSIKALSTLARYVSPGAVPNERGEDPWLIGLRNSEDRAHYDEYLYAFLLARALEHRTVASEELIVQCFEQVVMRAYNDRLTNECWLLLDV